MNKCNIFKGVNCNLPPSKGFASFLWIERGVLGCHIDIMLINMYKAQKVSAEGHSHPLQEAWPRLRPYHEDHCLLNNPVLLKSRMSVSNQQALATETSVISDVRQDYSLKRLNTHLQ